MANALNLTLALKQDAETKKKLAQLAKDFPTKVQPAIEKALRESRIVHYARVLVIDDKYLQVITEYDGDHKEYTEFFRRSLAPVFELLFSLAEGAPSWDKLDSNSFFELSKHLQIRSLGDATDASTDADGSKPGYLFSAYGSRTVNDILNKLG